MIGQGANPNFPSAPPVGGGVNSPYPSNQMPPIIGSGGSNQLYREFFCCHFFLKIIFLGVILCEKLIERIPES
jgi:hypothetical protein